MNLHNNNNNDNDNNNNNEISTMLSSLIEEKKYKNTHPNQPYPSYIHKKSIRNYPQHHTKFMKKTKKHINPEILTDKYDEIKNMATELNLQPENITNGSPEVLKELINNIQDYLEIDKTYLLKHNEFKKLYHSYVDSYKNNGNSVNDDNSVNSGNENMSHIDIVKSIHSEMKDNNTDLYKGRLMILKKIKEEPKVEPVIKNKLCGHLLAIFKRPPNSEYQQLAMLSQSNEKIAINELDNAYLQKHNELMIVYKAYQKLFNKVLNYKDVIEQYKKLPTKSSISRSHMNKLVSDQSFVMNMIDKMQDKLVDKNIISNTEKIPIHPVTSNPENIQTFNDTMKQQINYIVDTQTPIQPKLKQSIEKVLTKYKDCGDTKTLCCKKNYVSKTCSGGECKL